MASQQNLAAVQSVDKGPFDVQSVAVPELESHDMLIKNESVAFNPFEWKLQKLSIMPLSFPYFGGFTFAGTVEKVGDAVTAFQPGDKVVAKKRMPREGRDQNDYASFQRYSLMPDHGAAKLEPNADLDVASATVLNLITAVGALVGTFGFDKPDISSTAKAAPKKEGIRLLVYGGSTGVGQFALQLATLAGYDVVTTSSPANLSLVRPLGTAKIVDHSLPCDQIISRLAAAGPYTHVLDTVSIPATSSIMGQVVAKNIKAGGIDTFWSMGPVINAGDIPVNVKTPMSAYPHAVEDNPEVNKWFYGEFLPQALASGRIVPPKIEVLPGGLKTVQPAIEMMMKGVSGKKLVAHPWEE